MLVPWIYSTACMIIHWMVLGCPKTIDVQKMTLKYACAVPKSLALSPSALALSLTAIYVYLFAAVTYTNRKHRHVGRTPEQKKRQQHEWRLILQGAAIGFALLLANIGYNTFPTLSDHSVVAMLANWCNIFNCMLSPIILLTLNTVVRQYAVDMCTCSNQPAATCVLPLIMRSNKVAVAVHA